MVNSIIRGAKRQREKAPYLDLITPTNMKWNIHISGNQFFSEAYFNLSHWLKKLRSFLSFPLLISQTVNYKLLTYLDEVI